MSGLVVPHGGELVHLLLDGEVREQNVIDAHSLPQVTISSKELSDLIMLGIGAFSPLSGFLKQRDYASVVKDMRLTDGTLWPIPITLAVRDTKAADLGLGTEVALVAPVTTEIVGSLLVEEKYKYDRQLEAREVFRTEDEEHPGVASLYKQGDVYLAGPVKVFTEGGFRERFTEFATPTETRKEFVERGWTRVAAFQTRNPLHRSHEYLTKVAMEVCDGILIHPIVGKLKAGDIPAEVRMKTYRVLLENYYPRDRVVLRVYPLEMRYGGPREAVLHAIIRQNFGCSHIIIGRDHAGVGNYYGPFDAQRIFDELRPEDLRIEPLKLDTTFWCRRCGAVASSKTCPHSAEDHVTVSGTELRRMLAAGKRPPEEFTRPEVADILAAYYQEQDPKQ